MLKMCNWFLQNNVVSPLQLPPVSTCPSINTYLPNPDTLSALQISLKCVLLISCIVCFHILIAWTHDLGIQQEGQEKLENRVEDPKGHGWAGCSKGSLMCDKSWYSLIMSCVDIVSISSKCMRNASTISLNLIVTSMCCKRGGGCWAQRSATPVRTGTWCRKAHGSSTLAAPTIRQEETPNSWISHRGMPSHQCFYFVV